MNPARSLVPVLIICIFFPLVTASAQGFDDKFFVVGDIPEADYSALQAAIDAVPDGSICDIGATAGPYAL